MLRYIQGPQQCDKTRDHCNMTEKLLKVMLKDKQTIIYCMMGNFSRFICHLLIIFKINFFEKFSQQYHQNVKQFGSRSGPHFVGPDLGPNCLQMQSADDKSCH